MRDDFAVFIISHGRPECISYYNIKEYGYTGKIYVIVDDKDKSLDEYKTTFKDELHIFSKEYWIERTDTLDNFDGPNNIATYARSESVYFAKQLGLKYVFLLDDDIFYISYRFDENGVFRRVKAKNIDNVFEIVLDMMDKNPSFNLFGLQHPSRVHGKDTAISTECYSNYLFRVDKAPYFCAREGEDLIFHREMATKSYTMVTPIVNIDAMYNAFNDFVSQTGGMSDCYKQRSSRYCVTFPKILYLPNCIHSVLIKPYRHDQNEIYLKHNEYSQANSVKLLSEKYKKY